MEDPIAIRKKLGERVRALRERRGWSQEELANETGFGRSFTSSIERGTKDIRISTLVKLANIFEVGLEQLFNCNCVAGRAKRS
jgi:transcriptional regulator with XRE-family HTH domain